jgi:hypothetical protein
LHTAEAAAHPDGGNTTFPAKTSQPRAASSIQNLKLAHRTDTSQQEAQHPSMHEGISRAGWALIRVARSKEGKAITKQGRRHADQLLAALCALHRH